MGFRNSFFQKGTFGRNHTNEEDDICVFFIFKSVLTKMIYKERVQNKKRKEIVNKLELSSAKLIRVLGLSI